MTPTSLGVAGFAPAEGDMSSQTFTSTSDASDGGSSFRQFMTSYAQSQGDTDADSNAAKPAQEPARDADSRATDASAAGRSEPQSGAATANAARRSVDADKQEQEDGESSPAETPGSGAAATPPGESGDSAAASSRPSSPLAGLSPMQLLLSGGSLPQILGAANGAAYTAAAASGATATAGQSRASVSVLNGTATAEKPKTSRESNRNSKGAGETAHADAAHFDALEGGNSLALTGPGGSMAGPNSDSRKSQQGALEAIGGNGEALHTPGAEKTADAGKAAATNFAFAVRLTSDSAQTSGGQGEANAAAGDAPSLAMGPQHALLGIGVDATAATVEAAAKTGEHAEESPNDAALLFAGEHAPGAGTETSAAASETEAPAAAPATEPDPTATASDPVRNIRLQLDGENNQRVDIRLLDVGGEMRVSVRAGDTRLAQTLQDHIPDLANRLDTQHVRAEIWTPRTESPSSSNNSNTSGQSSRGSGDPSGQNSGQGGDRRQQNGQQKQPDWVDEFENYSSPTQTLRSNQLWPQ